MTGPNQNTIAPQDALTGEWATLQDNHEQYERNALLIKLVAVVAFTAGIFWPQGITGNLLLCVVQGVLWLQEGILRTSQARLGERLLRIEALARGAADGQPTASPALQLHSEWLATRPGTAGLVGEYLRNALRPTVAFPYALLLAFLLLAALG